MTGVPLSRSGKEALDVAIMAAQGAGEILKAHFREERQIRFKGRANIVTEVDLLAEDRLKTFQQTKNPDHTILSEHTDPNTGDSN